MLVISVMLSALQLPSILQVSDRPCASCRVTASRDFRIDGAETEFLISLPKTTVIDRRGRVFLINQRSAPDGPPEVFDTTGRHLATLGRRGRGPGEFLSPQWIEIGAGDTIRVFGDSRVVVFDPSFAHVRTVADRDFGINLFPIVMLDSGSYLTIATSYRPKPRDLVRPRPMILRDARGAMVREIDILPLGTGPSRVFAGSLSKGAFWIADFTNDMGTGYDVAIAGLDARARTGMQRRPAWWTQAGMPKTMTMRMPPPTSRVIDLRETKDGMLVVLIGQPRADWQRFPVEAPRFAGWWKRYETIVEVLDIRRRVVVGTTHVEGYPVHAFAGGVEVLRDLRASA